MILIDHAYKPDARGSTLTVGLRSLLAYAIYMNNQPAIDNLVSQNPVLFPRRTTLRVNELRATEEHLFSLRAATGQTFNLRFFRNVNEDNPAETLRSLLVRKYQIYASFAGGFVTLSTWDNHIPTAKKIVPNTIDIYRLEDEAFDEF